MDGNNKNRIISEDYADFIMDYNANLELSQLFPDSSSFPINNTYSVIHLPVSQFNNNTIKNIRLLKVPYLYGLASEVSIQASGIEKLRGFPDFNLRGNGVLIGIIDTGIKYTLSEFMKGDGSTKIHSIWDQTIQSENAYPFHTYFGTEYNQEQINEALKSENPLLAVPSNDENGHGTMLAAIAAGTENKSEDFFGVAPDAELVIVKLAQAKKYLRKYYGIPDDAICFQDNAIMWGIQYCLMIAEQSNRPISICIGIGSSMTDHSGEDPLPRTVSIAAGRPHAGVVTAAGNEGNLGRHFYGRINPSVGSIPVELNVGKNDKNFTMQLWGEIPGVYSIDILSPSGEYIPRIPAGLKVNRKINFIFEQTIILIEYQTVYPRLGDELIRISFYNTTEGIWKFNVYQKGDLYGNFHIWLPMGDFITKETYFLKANNFTTILAPGNAELPITVTAYNPTGESLYVSASKGYTRNNIIKPDLAAPGVNYIAPDINGEYKPFTGTGVASAHTTGIVALLLEWGVVEGNQPDFNTLDIKKYLIRGARRSSNLTYPNREWGYGILDIFNTFDVLRQNE